MYHQYNFTIQDEFRPGWLAEVAYVGSRGRNLLVLQNIGTGNDQGGPGSREVVLVSTSSSNSVIGTRYRGRSSYNAFQSKLEKRLAKGLSMLTSYTWAHAIDDSPGGVCANGAGLETAVRTIRPGPSSKEAIPILTSASLHFLECLGSAHWSNRRMAPT
jgi:hypothetical protein